MSDTFDLAAYQASLTNAIEETRKELEGKYGDEIKELLSLSKDEIDAITPNDTTDLATYEALMKIVKQASSKNIAQAELKNRIMALGDIAVEIVKKTGGLAARLGL